MNKNVLLENKLRNEWSAGEYVPYVSAEGLEYACKEFATLEIGIRVRLLLSVLLLTVPQLQSLWSNVQDLLSVAESDREEWVRVVLSLVKKRLPSKEAILQQDNNTPSSEQPKQVDGGSEVSDLFEESMQDMIQRLEGLPSDGLLSPDFVPLEWPYLCAEIFPQDIRIDNVNRYFTPRSRDTEMVEASSSASLGDAHDAVPTSSLSPTSAGQLSSKSDTEQKIKQALSFVNPDRFQRKSSVKLVDISELKDGVAEEMPSTIPESIQKILRDPENSKLTDESRALVYQFYNPNDTQRPSSGVQLILLSETREYVDANSAILATQLNLKLNYDDNTAKRIKSKKKYKLKEPVQM